MTRPRFLQIHTLHSYTAALINRDDTGQAKRLVFGGTPRTRISSQCLKRHWRMAKTDPHALDQLEGHVDSFRSRELVTELVIRPLQGRYAEDVVKAIEAAFQRLVYGENGDKGKKSRQTLLLGEPEINALRAEAEFIAAASSDAAEANAKFAARIGEINKEHKERKGGKGKKKAESAPKLNLAALVENAALPGGLTAALFGRMVTSDPAANIEAPVHVAHAFTIHAAEVEDDYFTAVDDLKRDEDDSGADHVHETELTSGLYYGYVVIDLPGLIANCGHCPALAGQVVHNLLHLIAEVSPGAKHGSTAPYGRAELMLVEAGDRQPRSLASAYRQATAHSLSAGRQALATQLAAFDEAYDTDEDRRHLCLDGELPGIARLSLATLAGWAATKVKDAPDA